MCVVLLILYVIQYYLFIVGLLILIFFILVFVMGGMFVSILFINLLWVCLICFGFVVYQVDVVWGSCGIEFGCVCWQEDMVKVVLSMFLVLGLFILLYMMFGLRLLLIQGVLFVYLGLVFVIIFFFDFVSCLEDVSVEFVF